VTHGCCADKACTAETCMGLPDSVHCGDCVHIARCKAIYGHTESDIYCDWFPRRFVLNTANETHKQRWRRLGWHVEWSDKERAYRVTTIVGLHLAYCKTITDVDEWIVTKAGAE